MVVVEEVSLGGYQVTWLVKYAVVVVIRCGKVEYDYHCDCVVIELFLLTTQCAVVPAKSKSTYCTWVVSPSGRSRSSV